MQASSATFAHLRDLKAYDASGVRAYLVDDLNRALEQGALALGFEGPLWGWECAPLGPYVRRVFERPTSAWYDRNGGQAAIKALALVQDVFGLVTPRRITYGLHGAPTEWGIGTLIVWEAYVTGAEKGVPDWPVGVQFRTTSSRRLEHASRKGVQENVWDAYAAVAYGFANQPLSAESSEVQGHAVSIADAALARLGLNATSCWRPSETLVIAPPLGGGEGPCGRLLWPPPDDFVLRRDALR